MNKLPKLTLPYGFSEDDEYVKGDTKVAPYHIKKGQVYVRPNESAPVIVRNSLDRETYNIRIQYFTGEVDTISPQFMWDTTYLGNNAPNEIEKDNNMTTTTKLYQIIGTETYGTHIATNSKGAYVLEMKGSGDVVTKTKAELEEVVPYTVSLKFLTDSNYTNEYAYFSKEGDVRVGDLVNVGSGMAMITATNTRSTKATKDLEGYVVVTKKIGE